MKHKFEIGDEVIYWGSDTNRRGLECNITEIDFANIRLIKDGGDFGPGYRYKVAPDITKFNPRATSGYIVEEALRPKPKDDFKRFMDKALEPVNIEGGLEVLYESQVYTR